MSAGWRAIRWAKTVPPARRKDGKPDSVAQHVLLVLATFADKDGRARPGLSTLATETYLSDDTVESALERLVDAGLISRGGSFNGTTVWTLNMSIGPDGTVDDEFAERRERARIKRNERQKRYSQRRKLTDPDAVSTDGAEDRQMTVLDTVRRDTDDGVGDRQMTVLDTVTNGAGHRQMTVPTSSSSQVTPAVTAIELPTELPMNTRTPPTLTLVREHAAQPRKRRSVNAAYTPDFEAFWVAYGKKGSKRDAAVEWHRAITRASAAAIMAPVAAYVAATPDLRWRKGAERWLRGDCWESEIVSPARTSSYRPFRNSADPNAYEGDLLP